MTTAPAKATERGGDKSSGCDHTFASPATAPMSASKSAALLCDTESRSRHMALSTARSVTLVSHTRKLSPRAKASPNHCQTKTHRRRKCATVLNVFRTAQPSVAPFATESLALSATTPGEPLSVQRSAPIDSRLAERTIADSCLGFRPPNRGCGDNFAASSRSSLFWS
jgi:hypothetical protein